MSGRGGAQAGDGARLGRQMGLLFAGRTAAFALVFALPLLLARLFPPETFGLYKQLFLVHATLTAVLGCGLVASLFYFVPRRAEEAPAFVAQALLGLTVAGLAGAAVLAALRGPVAGAMGNPALAPYLPAVGLLTVLSVTTSLIESLLLILKEAGRSAAAGVLSELLRAALIGAAAAATRDMGTVLLAATAWGGCRLAALLVLLRRRGIPWLARPDRRLLVEQVRYAAPFGLAVLVKTLAENLHQFVVSARSSPAVFALYAVGCLQIPLVAIACEAVTDVTLLRVTELRVAGALDEAAALVRESVGTLCLLLLPLWAWLTVAAEDLIVLLFTEPYASAAPIFRVMLLMIPLAALGLDYVPRAFGETAFILRLNLLRLAVGGALLAALTGPLGPVGAALATVIAMAVAKGAALGRAGRLLGPGPARLLPWRLIGRLAAAAWLAALAAWAVHAGGGFDAATRLGLSLGLFLAGFLALAPAEGLRSLRGLRGVAARAGARLRSVAALLPTRG